MVVVERLLLLRKHSSGLTRFCSSLRFTNAKHTGASIDSVNYEELLTTTSALTG